jgi:hypothetical protein
MVLENDPPLFSVPFSRVIHKENFRLHIENTYFSDFFHF